MSLVDEIKSGNKDAIKQVYQENAKEVYEFAKGITGDHDTAMKATKNTFIKLFKQIQSGDEPTNLRSAALKVCYDEACKLAVPAANDEEDEAAKTRVIRPERTAKKRAESYDDEDDIRYADDDDEQEERRVKRTTDRSKKPARKNYDEDYDYDDDYDDDDEYETSRGAAFYVFLVINIILALILIWFIIGLLINLGVLPSSLDLGYTWFDNHIYPLF